MVITDLHVVCVAVDKAKADSPLIVDSDRMLSLPVILECVETIPRRHLQVVQARRKIDVLKLARGSPGDIRGNRLTAPVANRSRVRPSANVLIIA